MIETIPTIPFPASELKESIRTFTARYKELMAYYRCAMMEVETKFRVLSENFSLEEDRNPIEAIKTRMKSPESIRNKLKSRDLPLTIESIEKNLNDVAGVRVICGFPGDISVWQRHFSARMMWNSSKEKTISRIPSAMVTAVYT